MLKEKLGVGSQLWFYICMVGFNLAGLWVVRDWTTGLNGGVWRAEWVAAGVSPRCSEHRPANRLQRNRNGPFGHR